MESKGGARGLDESLDGGNFTTKSIVIKSQGPRGTDKDLSIPKGLWQFGFNLPHTSQVAMKARTCLSIFAKLNSLEINSIVLSWPM
jgi:hypothetical protein